MQSLVKVMKPHPPKLSQALKKLFHSLTTATNPQQMRDLALRRCPLSLVAAKLQRSPREDTRSLKDCQLFPKQLKPYAMWLVWLAGVKPNWNMNYEFTDPDLRGNPHQVVQNFS